MEQSERAGLVTLEDIADKSTPEIVAALAGDALKQQGGGKGAAAPTAMQLLDRFER